MLLQLIKAHIIFIKDLSTYIGINIKDDVKHTN